MLSAANDKFNKLMEEVKSNSEKVGPANGGQRYAFPFSDPVGSESSFFENGRVGILFFENWSDPYPTALNIGH